jgi:RHS repeat-associated protein
MSIGMRARARARAYRGRVAVVAVALLLIGGTTGSGPGIGRLGRPAPAAAETPVAPITGCSAAEDDSTDPAAAGVPARTGGAFTAALKPGAAGAKPTRIGYAGAAVIAGPQATDEPVTVGITPLPTVPELDPGMVNVTETPQAGYQFTPHPYEFDQPVQVEIPYDDTQAAAASASTDEIYTFFYDETAQCWRPLKRLSVDTARQVIVSETTHFTDMINATVAVPDMPQGTSFDPTQIKGIQAADPASKVNLIQPPAANNGGTAALNYPIELPAGRAGVQPSLAVAYNSGGGDGWLGMGWDLGLPMVSIDTRFGVPRYDGARETETYLLGGAQLTPLANRAGFAARAAEKTFHTRVEGGFAQIVRHGSTPKDYSWEVTDKAGVRYTYGGTPDSVLTDDRGNVFQWALREMRDLHGNVMRYTTVRQDDPGIAGSTVPGRNLYLKKITYTGFGAADGPYSVTFTRDRELAENRRPDVMIDARGGFKRVTADLLRRIEVRLGGDLVRRYDLNYRTGAFAKTLLASISQFDTDGRLFTTHSFDYFDDIRDASGAYRAFTAADFGSPDDNLRNGTIGALAGDAGEAGAINGNTSTSIGGHVYVGVSLTRSKTGSVGVKTGFNNSSDTGLVALVDVDGDGLVDKVFRSGGGVSYRKNLSGPTGQLRFADAVTPLRTLPGILSESSSSLTVGVEAYPGVAVQLDHVDTTTTTDRYFADVNGDDIPDLVNGSSVLFGHIGTDGVPAYGLSSASPAPIGTSHTDASGVIGDFSAARERQIDSHPLTDAVRRWTAPFDGTVQVTGSFRLVQDTSPERAAYTKADGVRVAVQRGADELFSALVGPDDFAAHTPTGVDRIAVHRGDALYFRVGSRFDGAFDQVDWDPAVSYVDKPDQADVNGLPVFDYRASSDFTFGGRTSQVAVPATGTLHLTGALTKRGPTTDDVTAVVTRDGVPVFSQRLPADATGDIPLDLDVPVTQGQLLRWRIAIDSPVDLAQLTWTPHAFYTAADGVTRLTDENGNPTLTVDPPYDIDMYPADDLTAPQESFTPAASGDLTVAPTLALDAEHPAGRVVFTVKKRGALLAKKAIDVAANETPTIEPLTVPVTAGEPLFLDFSTVDTDLTPHVTGHGVTAGFGPDSLAPVPSALHRPAAEGAFAQPYRGWASIGYNGNRDRANAPIAEGDLVLDAHYRDQLPTDVDPQRDKDAFAANPKVDPPKFVQLTPVPARARWEADDNTFVTAAGVSSSRLGGAAITLPDKADFDNVTAVPRVGTSSQISLTGSIGGTIGSIGGSVATGDSDGELDYLDLNGDRFPDIVGRGGVQYTDPTGQLGATRSSIPDGAVRRSSSSSGNVAAGSAARTISTGRGQSAPTGTTTANDAESGNDMPPLGIGGSHGTSESDARFDLLDINGDGLPDRVYADGRAALNLGYAFAAPETWGGGALNTGRGSSNGLNLGFNTDFYGFAGGASFSAGHNTSSASLADMNGDGLIDRVFDGSPIRVALNTGTGFLPPTPFLGGLSGVSTDVNAQLGGGAYFEFHFCAILGLAGCIIVNPGASVSTGASRSEQAIRDINGDGFADQLRSTNDSQLQVAENNTGRTNLLRTVKRPLGARIDLDYTRDGNTADQPQSRFVLSKVTTDDGHPGDGADVQESTFRYSGGVYDRQEREFRGYGRVLTEQRDPAAGDAVLRTSTQDFRTDSHYTIGLQIRTLTSDGAGHPFTETLTSYQLRDVDAPNDPADPASTTATVFPQLVRTDERFYEGQPDPVKQTHTDMSYDSVGNLIRSFDTGEPGAADDVETKVRYSVENGACQDVHLIGTALSIQVRGNGVLMRQRDGTIDCDTGDMTRNRALLADGTPVVTDFTHFDNGNIESVTYPPNHRNQRYRIDYTYDPVLDTYPATVADSFGLESSTLYDARFGLPSTQFDQNKQAVQTSYDTLGRVATVTAPREAGDTKPTIAFEYHPEAATPYALSRHADRDADGKLRTDTLDTVTFVDGYDRAVQTKADASVSTAAGARPAAVMTVSGRSVLDALGRTVEQSYPITEPKGAANTTFNPGVDPVRPARTSYDTLDRPLRTELPDGTANTTVYGFGADRAGGTQFEATATDANGNVKRTYTDVRKQITAEREANPAGNQPTIWTSYGFDALGEITAVTDDHGNATTAAYDNLGRRTAVTTPDGGRTQTVYDRANNQVQTSTAGLAASGQTVDYDYDFTRLNAARYPNFPANNVTYTYGAPGAAANAAGRVTVITDAAGSVTRKYGSLGETSQETRVIHGVFAHDTAYTTSYDYDSFNRMLDMTYPDGEVLTYHYDTGGQVDKATGVKSHRTYPYLNELDYDKFGQRLQLQLGNGTKTSYTYNADDRRLATLKSVLPHGDTFQNQSYGYDDVGNVTTISNDVEVPHLGGLELGGPSSQTFGYDGLNRLTSSTGQFQPERNKLDSYTLSMSYDSLGDVTSKDQRHSIGSAGATAAVQALTTPAPPAGTYAFQYAYAGTQPHAPTTVGPLAMRYDANGNLISRSDTTTGGKRRQFVWDEDNRLACTDVGNPAAPDLAQSPAGCAALSKDGVRFTYDSTGQRVVKDAGKDKTTVYPSPTFDQRGGAAFKHIFVGDTRLVSKMVEPSILPEKNQFYFHPDHLGSTSYGTDANGKLVDHQQYFPSGETWVDETKADPTPFQFNGKELDAETGLYYYGARYYDPTTTLWQSSDPAAGSYLDGKPSGGVYQSANLGSYTYAYNNPTRYTDPNGQFVMVLLAVPWLVEASLGIATGVAAYYGITQTQKLLNSRSGSAPAESAPAVQRPAPSVGLDEFGFANRLERRATQGEIEGAWEEVKTHAAERAIAQARSRSRTLPTLEIDAQKMPNIARVIGDAIDSGAQPDVLNYNANPVWQAANRILACGTFAGAGSCEEYAFASTMQGGLTSVTGGVPIREQYIEGGTLRGFYARNGMQHGDPFRVVVTNRDRGGTAGADPAQ